MKEEWRDVPGFEGIYQVSNTGNVKSSARYLEDGRFRKERTLKPYKDRDGYKKVTFWAGLNHHRHYTVHRLVAMAFIPNPNNLPQINHKDENPANNNVNNLEWCDVRYNINYGTRSLKASISLSGENRYNHKLTNEIVKYIRTVYIPGDPNFGQTALGKRFGVSQSVIKCVVHKQTWKYV